MSSNRVALTALLLILSASGYDNIRRVADALLDHRSPRQRYVDALNGAGLGTTALAVDGRFGEFALVRSSRGVAGWVFQQ
jgi:hypothetical protein